VNAAPADVLAILEQVKDPEVPVISIVELGIVRGVEVDGDTVRVDITPTYSGCPAMRTIEEEVVATLREHGFREVTVRTVFQPAWTTEWIGEEARRKLREYGIAPPGHLAAEAPIQLGPTVRRVACPFCGSTDTELRSSFGSTACKALHYCTACRQPFEHFKAI
jgi:ring-1,2-phenylacetyl-CoA epoxidase subunit PaaD